MIGMLLGTLAAALLSDARHVERRGPERQGPQPWRDLGRRTAQLPERDRAAVLDRWLIELPAGWTPQIAETDFAAQLGDEGPMGWPDPDDADAGIWHVTTRLGQVWETGAVLPARQVGRAGLGGGYLEVARDRVSATWSLSRARHLQEVLRLAVLAANDQVSAGDLARRVMGLVGPALRAEPDSGVDRERQLMALLLSTNPEIPRSLYEDVVDVLSRRTYGGAEDLDAQLKRQFMTHVVEDDESDSDDPNVPSSAEETLNWFDEMRADPDLLEREALAVMIENVEGNTWIPMRAILEGRWGEVDAELARQVRHGSDRGALDDAATRGALLYELVRVIDKETGALLDLPGEPSAAVGLTCPWTALAGLQADDVRVLRLVIRRDADLDVIPEELEVRLRPHDVALAPVVFGGAT